MIPSWRDLQPDGPYLNALFAQPLPSAIDYTLLFGHLSGEGLLREPSDGTILVSSQLRSEAQRDAALVMGFDETHAGIRSSSKVVSEVQRVLASAAGGAEPGGNLQLGVRVATGGLEPAGISSLVLRRLDGEGSGGADDFTLAVTDIHAGAKLGPLPPGEYEVRLAAASFRALFDRQRLRIRIRRHRRHPLQSRSRRRDDRRGRGAVRSHPPARGQLPARRERHPGRRHPAGGSVDLT